MIDRIIVTVGKHVIAQQSLSRGRKCISIDESANLRVVASGLEVVEPILFIIAYSSIGLFYSISAHPVKLF